MNDCCYVGLQQELERIEVLRQRQAEKRCLEVAREIYRFLEAHPRSALHGKRITIHVKKEQLVADEKSGEASV